MGDPWWCYVKDRNVTTTEDEDPDLRRLVADVDVHTNKVQRIFQEDEDPQLTPATMACFSDLPVDFDSMIGEFLKFDDAGRVACLHGLRRNYVNIHRHAQIKLLIYRASAPLSPLEHPDKDKPLVSSSLLGDDDMLSPLSALAEEESAASDYGF